MAGLTLIIVVPGNSYFKFLLNEFAVHIMLCFMLSAIVFLVYDRNYLLFTALICAASMALHLKLNTQVRLQFAKQEMLYSFGTAVFNLEKIELKDQDDVIREVLKRNPEILIFSSLNPVWTEVLSEKLSNSYNNYRLLERIDKFGLGLYSRYPIEKNSEIISERKPIYIQEIKIPFLRKRIRLISSNFTAPNNKKLLNDFYLSIQSLENYLSTTEKIPTMITGNFGVAQWNNRLSTLRKNQNYFDSRRSFVSILRNDVGLLYLHINKNNLIYSEELECSSFDDIYINNELVGFIANYQLTR
jgi:hypothetical protein